MSNSKEIKIDLTMRFARLGVPEKVWELIREGLDLPEEKQRELYCQACRVAASQIPEPERRVKLRGHGLNILFGLIELPKRLP